MHILQCTEELIHDVGLVNILQYVCSDDSMQICFHVVKDQIDVLIILSLQHILQPVIIADYCSDIVCLSLTAVYRQYVMVMTSDQMEHLLDDVFMRAKFLQEHDFTERPLQCQGIRSAGSISVTLRCAHVQTACEGHMCCERGSKGNTTVLD